MSGRQPTHLLCLLLVGFVGLSGCRSFGGPSVGMPAAKPEQETVGGEGRSSSAESARADRPADAAAIAGEDLDPVVPIPDLQGAGDLEDELPESDSEPIDAAARLAESLRTFESAQAFWQEGDYDDALAALDQAYELMATVPDIGDARVEQEREELRRLIARQIVEVYASRRIAVGEVNSSIPIVLNDDVRREIESFRTREREFFDETYRRSGLYRPMILEELGKLGLPEQLSWVPFIESGFKVRAYSSARALGLWQFISSTGYRFGLERNYWVDERMDPVKSTRAAIAYLTELHGLFGDWMTAVAGYNCGEHLVLRRIRQQPVSYFDDFWDLYSRLPRETRRHVPRLLAVLAIIEDPSAYGFDLPEPYPPLDFKTVRIDRAVDLAALDGALQLPPGTLADLNPELRRKVTPDRPYDFRVPGGSDVDLTTALGQLPEVAGGGVGGVHRVRSGETLSQIAEAYNTSVREIVAMNNLRSPDRIRLGQQLQVPGSAPRRADGGTGIARAPEADGVPRTVNYVVGRGDTLWKLAQRYGTTVNRIQQDNGLRGSRLSIGQQLSIRTGRASASVAASGSYVVRNGDTLAKIAASHGVALDRLMSANGLSRRSTIHPGQQLAIPR